MTNQLNEPYPNRPPNFDVEADTLLPSLSANGSDNLVNPEVEALDKAFIPRFGDTLGTLFLEELPEKGHRTHRIGAFTLGLATQAVDRGRAMVFVLPTAFDETLEYAAEHGFNGYQTAGAAGLVVGGLFGAWGYVVGKAFHKAVDAFPATTQKVVENHPVMVGVVSDAIDGFPSKEELVAKQPVKPEEGYDVGPYDSRKSFLGKAALAVTRGLKTAFLFGPTIHVGVAEVSEHSDKSVEKRRRVVTREAAGAVGAVAVGISAMVTHDFLGAAEQVRDAITDKQNLLGASAFFIGFAALSNWLSRKNYIRRRSTSAEASTNNASAEVSELQVIEDRA